jgi:hypothetical protein
MTASATTTRPLSVTIIAWLFIAVGAVAFTYHVTEFKAHTPFDYRLASVCVIRLLAIVGGVFLLRGRNWARWLLLGWLAFHVFLSIFHAFGELLMHALLLAVLAFCLFRPASTRYFKGLGPGRIPPEVKEQPDAD